MRGWLPDFSTVFDFATQFGTKASGTFMERSSADGSLEHIVATGQGLTGEHQLHRAPTARWSSSKQTSSCPAAQRRSPASPTSTLWDRDSGQISLAGVLNDEQSPPAGAFAGPYDWMLNPALPLTANARRLGEQLLHPRPARGLR